jgi:hypothetical protein
MIPDYAGYLHATQFVEYVRTGAPRDNNAGIQCCQLSEQIASADPHDRPVRVLDNRRQCSIEIEGAQRALLD